MQINVCQDSSLNVDRAKEGSIKRWECHILPLMSDQVLKKICDKTNQKREPVFDIILTSNAHIKELNHFYRKTKQTTDVLTFTYDDERLPWGDIFISMETAERQAQSHNIALEEELTLLTIHGILHACGLDHEISNQDHQIIRNSELKILESLNLKHVAPLLTK